jgi:hypothetical protein
MEALALVASLGAVVVAAKLIGNPAGAATTGIQPQSRLVIHLLVPTVKLLECWVSRAHSQTGLRIRLSFLKGGKGCFSFIYLSS